MINGQTFADKGRDTMSELGYAVYSELECGLLIGTGPSLWHFDFDAAIRYPTEQQARQAAGKRSSSLAKAVKLVELDGKLHLEELPDPQPERGGWVITLTDSTDPGRTFYVTAGGKTISITTEARRAKSYRQESKARKIAESFDSSPRFRAEVKQLTAEILPFRNS